MLTRPSGYETAIILAGGQGTRFRELGAVFPKCLLPIFDQPLLFRQIERCALAGARRVVVSIANKYGDLLEAALALYTPPPGVSVECQRELSPLGAPRGLAALAPLVRASACLVVLGDEYYADERPFRAMGAAPRSAQMIVGIVRSSIPSRIACNVVLDAHGHIECIRDKPLPSAIVGDTRWACFCALEAGLLDRASELVEAGRIPGAYIGDVFEGLRLAGVSTATIDVEEVELNVNSVDDLVLATLFEAWRASPATSSKAEAYRSALGPLLEEQGVPLELIGPRRDSGS